MIVGYEPFDGEDDVLFRLKPALVYSHIADPFTAGPFDVFQVIRIIDDPREIGVFIVNAGLEAVHLKDLLAGLFPILQERIEAFVSQHVLGHFLDHVGRGCGHIGADLGGL